MKVITICIVFFSFSLFINGQSRNADVQLRDPLSRLQQKELKGKLTLDLDTLVLENYNKHLVLKNQNQGIRGYRIRIFSNIGIGERDSQLRVKANFLSQFPEIPIYDGYDESYYKIYVGDFRTKRDALKPLETIKRHFPDAFIVESTIVIKE
jgi:hypothetical protein